MSTYLVAISEAARMVGVSTYTIRRLIASGDVLAVNVGARRLVPVREIDRIVRRGAGQGRAVKVDPKAE
jgi:excisionase family DNA binding protein